MVMQVVDIKKIQEEAEKELQQEKERQLIDELKVKLKTKRPLSHRLFPWKITVTRR